MPAVNKKPNLSSFACSALSSTMRLIHTERLQLEEFADEIPPYAVLSHRWGKDEVTFQDILLNQNHDTEGYRKVENICKVANQDGFEYAWIDTCCINKESSAELSEAINSMFRWYLRTITNLICQPKLETVCTSSEAGPFKSSLLHRTCVFLQMTGVR